MAWFDDTTGTEVHTDVAGEVAAVAEKAAPVDADLVLIEDSEDGNAKKRVQVGNLPGGGGGGAGAAYAETIGDGAATAYTITHNLGTTDLIVQLWDLTGTDPAEATADAASIEATDDNTVVVTFAAAPATDAYRAVIASGAASGGGGSAVVAYHEDETPVDADGHNFLDGTTGSWTTAGGASISHATGRGAHKMWEHTPSSGFRSCSLTLTRNIAIGETVIACFEGAFAGTAGMGINFNAPPNQVATTIFWDRIGGWTWNGSTFTWRSSDSRTLAARRHWVGLKYVAANTWRHFWSIDGDNWAPIGNNTSFTMSAPSSINLHYRLEETDDGGMVAIHFVDILDTI